MFSVMLLGAVLAGIWWLVAIGAPIAIILSIGAYFAEKPTWKVDKEHREAGHY